MAINSSLKKILNNNYIKFRHYKNILNKNNFLILIYHRVVNFKFSNDFFGTLMSEKNFVKQISYLKENYEIIPLSSISEDSNNNKTKVVITFDDGYIDNFSIVLPILKNFNINASFFIPTHYINKEKPLWDYEIYQALENSNNNLIIIDEKSNFYLNREKEKNNFHLINKLSNYCRFLDYNKFNETLFKIFKDLDYKKDNYSNFRCMNDYEIKSLSKNGMEIGSHGKSHLSFSTMNNNDAMKELEESKKIIEDITSNQCNYFAFPFGSKKDFNYENIQMAKKIGFKNCLLNTHGYNKKGNFELNRIIMNENKQTEYLFG